MGTARPNLSGPGDDRGRPTTVAIATPAARGTRLGNRITALRWAGILRGLGCRVFVEQEYAGRPCDLVIALHARRSHNSVVAAIRTGRPVVLVLTGTDLYRDLEQSPEVRESLALADVVVGLQSDAVTHVPSPMRDKTRVIYQSARARFPRRPPDGDGCTVGVLGHLRAVKDPLLLAQALHRLPPESRVRGVLIGGELEPGLADEARRWSELEPRFSWLGEMARASAMRELVGWRALVVTSRLEGAANSISEALAHGVPILSTRMSGAVGMLGEDHPGLFPVGDAEALADCLRRLEGDGAYVAELEAACAARRPLVDPEREVAALRRLLSDLGVGS